MSLSHATIYLQDEVAAIPGRLINVQFNPTDYSLDKSAQIAEINIPGIDSPILQFIRGQNEKLTLDLFFDTTSQGMDEDAVSVNTLIEPVYQLVKMQPETHAPPRIIFTWGDLSFYAITQTVQRKYNLFSPLGNPLRATLSVTFLEYKTLEQQLAEINPQSADHTRVYTVDARDTILVIAQQAYGDPGAWRVIAEENGIDDPLQLVPGQSLRIPPRPTRAATPRIGISR